MCYPFPLLCVFFPPSDAFVSSCKGHSLSPLVCICMCVYGWVESDTKAETEDRRCQNSVAAAPDSLPTVGVELFVSDRYEANEHTSTRVCVCFKIFRFRSYLPLVLLPALETRRISRTYLNLKAVLHRAAGIKQRRATLVWIWLPLSQ